MQTSKVIDILKKIQNVKVAVYGDFCLDAYWILDPKGSEISVETGIKAQSVKTHYYSLGGASNIVANLAALSPSSIIVVGVIGDDIFGREIERQFKGLGVNTSHLVIQKKDYSTITFGKRYYCDKEKTRIDFGFLNKHTDKTDKMILDSLDNVLQLSDVFIFNQQVPNSITNYSFIEEVNKIFKKNQHKIVIADTRHYGKDIKYTCLKINSFEAAILNNEKIKKDAVVNQETLRIYGRNLFNKFNKPVFITMGARGILAIDKDGCYQIPAINLSGKLDTVGAGDTVTSALSLCLGIGENPECAAEFANLAATVTVQKLFLTGTASPEELIEISRVVDCSNHPDHVSIRKGQ